MSPAPLVHPRFRKKIAKDLPESVVAQITAFSNNIPSLELSPATETFDLLQSVSGIDIGEAVLYGVLADHPATLLTTNDKRSMRVLCSEPALDGIRGRVAGRVIGIETVARRLVLDHGAAAVAAGFAPLAAQDAFLRVAFTKVTSTDTERCLEAIDAYLADLRRCVGGDFLYDL